MTRKELIELGSTVAILVSVGVAYGRISTRLDETERRVEALEKTAQPGTKLADICLQLITEQENGDTKAIQDQMNRFHCYDRVPASTRSADATSTVANMSAVNATTAVQNR